MLEKMLDASGELSLSAMRSSNLTNQYALHGWTGPRTNGIVSAIALIHEKNSLAALVLFDFWAVIAARVSRQEEGLL